MERRIQDQHRGRDTSTFRTSSHRYKTELSHKKSEDEDTISETAAGVEHNPARSVPIALVEFEGEQRMILTPKGTSIGEELQVGVFAEIKPGNALPFTEIPEDVLVCSVEHQLGDGGKFIRASGVNAWLLLHDRKAATMKLPSDKVRHLNPNCRVTIDVAAGGGRTERPSVETRKKYHKMEARSIRWPRVRSVAMNAVDHPFGGGGWQHPGQPKFISRNAPPGQKVGGITSKRTGRGGGGGK